MGYRIRLGKIPKSEHEKFIGKTYEESRALLAEGECFYRLKAHTELYEIGKNCSYENEHLTDFYSFDISELEESDFRILSRDGLIKLIDDYKADIAEYYAELFDKIVEANNGNDREDLVLPEGISGEILSMLHAKRNDWCSEYSKIVQLESGRDGEMTGSWRMEYAIFNIVHILKTFDWDNDYLIYSGW
ncbi:hypothetical protein KW516_18715 [Vibrio fluvialis]|nr:hypothetical protein [Vibrio fluvialis]